MSTVKVNRALALASVGRNPASASDMLAAIPQAIIAALTSRQIAELMDAMWHACQRSKALAAQDAIDEGAIWDARRQQLVELAH